MPTQSLQKAQGKRTLHQNIGKFILIYGYNYVLT